MTVSFLLLLFLFFSRPTILGSRGFLFLCEDNEFAEKIIENNNDNGKDHLGNDLPRYLKAQNGERILAETELINKQPESALLNAEAEQARREKFNDLPRNDLYIPAFGIEHPQFVGYICENNGNDPGYRIVKKIYMLAEYTVQKPENDEIDYRCQHAEHNIGNQFFIFYKKLFYLIHQNDFPFQNLRPNDFSVYKRACF